MAQELLFYNEYEQFYSAAARSAAFSDFCRAAYGADFSQDGFSDKSQIDMIFSACQLGKESRVLDIGCGNGRMLRYINEQTGAGIFGFDYSENAIKTAQDMKLDGAQFRVGYIGDIDYPAGCFDLAISMDTMYFAPDMTAFVGQIKRWLAPEGILFVGYQEGDVVPKTEDAHTTLIAQALRENEMPFNVTDITRQTYNLLRHKRETAELFRDRFMQEGTGWLYELLIGQTECVQMTFEEYCRGNARYIYTAVNKT